MTSKGIWLAALAAISIGLHGCTTDEATGNGLLDLDGDNDTDVIDPAEVDLVIVGPGNVGSGGVAVIASCEQTGFLARLTDGDGDAIPNTFIRVVPTLGRVRAASGNSNGGATTNSNGEARFIYVAPDNVATNDFDELTAFTGIEDETIESDPYEVEVTTGGRPTLTLVGPGNVQSGDLEIPASRQTASSTRRGRDSFARSFLAQVRPAATCQSRADRTVTLNAPQGRIDAPPGSINSSTAQTSSAGTVEFDFLAPSGVSTPTDILIAASTTVARQTGTANYLVRVLPPEITFTGPADAFPGTPRTGFSIRLTDADGVVIAGERVTVSATQGTVEHVPSNQNQGNFETDSFGRLAFNYTPPANINTATNVTITANAFDLGITRTLLVTVRPDTFRFASPTSNTAVNVGVANAADLIFEWRNAAGAGVAGTVVLTSTSNDARFLVNSDVESRGVRSVTVDTNASGAFQVPVRIFSNFSEFVTVTASSQANSQVIARLPIQFVDQPGSDPDSAILTATPTAIDATTDPGATADLLFQVTNSANEPIDGINVTFEIIGGSTHPNEEIFPIGGTTRQGQARSTYFTRPGTGAVVPVTLRACIEGGSICDDYQITVE